MVSITKYVLAAVVLILTGCTTQKTTKKAFGVIETNYGTMVFSFYDKTPNHKKSFISLANAHYWDSLTFNRVIKDFVIQGGCPDTPKGFDDSHYLLEPEFSEEIKHVYGAVGMGRDDNPEKKSAGCQFYIVNKKEGLPFLDGNYTVFGKLISGFDVLDSISHAKTNSLDEPLKPVSLNVHVLYK